MWCYGRGASHGSVWVPTLRSCKAHDRSRYRSPLPPAQLPQSTDLYANGTPRRCARELTEPGAGPAALSEGKINQGSPTAAVGQCSITHRTSHYCKNRSYGSGAANQLPIPTGADDSARRWAEKGQGGGAAPLTPATGSTGADQEHVPAKLPGFTNVLGVAPPRGSSSGGNSVGMSGSDRDADTLIWTIVGRGTQRQRQQPQEQAADSCGKDASNMTLYGNQPAAPPGSGAASYWDAASLLQALDKIPNSDGANVCSLVSEPTVSGPGGGVLRDQAGGLLNLGAAGLGGPASPGHSHSLQQLHVTESVRGLLSSIAPSSALTASPERPCGVPSPYGFSQSVRAAPAPAPAPRSRARAQSVAAPLGLEAAGSTAAAWAGTTRAREGDLEGSTNAWQQQQPKQPQLVTRPGVAMWSGVLLGPHIASRGPAAAALVCAAVDVALPPWATSLLPQPQAAAGLRLDPSLEWALGVLSDRVTPLEPRVGELHLANRILASHLGPQAVAPQATAGAAAKTTSAAAVSATAAGGDSPVGTAAAAAAGSGGSGTHASMPTLPWPLVLPVLDAVAGRLSPQSALALLRVVSLQVGPSWRRELSPRHQAHLAATLQACFRAALRNPEAVSPSAAAALMTVMSRLRLRSPPACSLLVARILTGVVPVRRTRAAASATPAAGPAPAGAAEALGRPADNSGTGQPSSRGSVEPSGDASSSGGPHARLRSHGATSTRQAGGSSRIGGGGSSWSGGRLRNTDTPVNGRAAPAGRATRRSRRRAGGSAGGCGGVLVLAAHRGAQLRWVCVALSALARLRVPESLLPQRTVTKLLWAALFASVHWTPAIAAALPVWADRLACRPPAAFLRGYGRILLSSSDASSHPSEPAERDQDDAVSAAASNPASTATRRGRHRRCLVDQMTASQLMGAMEALVARYGPGTVAPVTGAAATVPVVSGAGTERSDEVSASRNGGSDNNDSNNSSISGASSIRRPALRYPSYQALMRALVGALSRRVRQLNRQQLCRLPLLLRQAWQPAETQWQQSFLLRARRLLPSFDMVDVMLLLRGLAGPAPGAPRAVDSQVTAAVCAFQWLGAELADDALRRYSVLLPSASLYHTAAVLESLALLWRQPPQPEQPPPQYQYQGGRGYGSSAPPQQLPDQTQRPPPPPPSSAMSRTGPAAAAPAPVEPGMLLSPSLPTPDLPRRKLASERDFLLQQLDEHVAVSLSYGGGGAAYGRGGGRGRIRAAPDGQVDLRAAASPGLVVKILTAYSRLQRAPAPRLQSALEAALVAGGQALGTSGWQAVRGAYQQLRLQPGRELSVALLTFV